MQKILVLSFLFIQYWASAQNQAELWRQDIDYLEKELSERHFNLFEKIDKENFHKALESIKQQLSNYSEATLALALQQVIVKAGDSHTNLTYYEKVKDGPIFPIFEAYWFKEGIFITKTTGSNRVLLGKKLIAINDMPIQEVVDKLSTLFVADNEALIKKNIPTMLSSSTILSFLGITDQYQASFTVKELGESPRKFNVRTIQQDQLFKYTLLQCERDSIEFSLTNKKTWFWQRYFPEEAVLYIQYNKCDGREVRKKYYKDKDPTYPSFKAFAKKALKTMKKEQVKKLVFDMRFNGGGSSLQGTKLVNKIAKLKAINGKKKIYVAIGRNTFSSAILNTLDFEKRTDAQLIGEATSGKPNHYGEIRSFKLPNSQFKIYYSTKYFKKVEKDLPTITPDTALEWSFDDYLKGKDPVWEFIKQ